MPSVVLSSFLQIFFTRNLLTDGCVNALSRAFFISTIIMRNNAINGDNVSMPSVVLSSFLPKASRITQEDLKMCQCPQSCFLHFYTNTGVINLGYYDYVSMPSVVLSSFLQIRKINCFQDHWVSMPSVVLSSFLRGKQHE